MNPTWHTHHTTQQRAQHRLNNENKARHHTTRTNPERTKQQRKRPAAAQLPLSLSHTQPTQQRAAEGTTTTQQPPPATSPATTTTPNEPSPHTNKNPTKTHYQQNAPTTNTLPTKRARAHAQRTLWKTESNTFQKTQRPPKTRHTQPTPVNKPPSRRNAQTIWASR